jgi:hypothetical protein
MGSRTWRNQFQDYPVPGEIESLATSGVIVDTSWGNDICPSFEMYRHGHGIRIWVDHPDPEQREMKSPTRFAVMPLIRDAHAGVWVMPDPTPTLLATDLVAEVLALVETFDRQPLEVIQ